MKNKPTKAEAAAARKELLARLWQKLAEVKADMKELELDMLAKGELEVCGYLEPRWGNDGTCPCVLVKGHDGQHRDRFDFPIPILPGR